MATPRLLLTRTSDDGTKALGVLDVYATPTSRAPVARFLTLERPWLSNRVRLSCIPDGTYRIERRTSQRFGTHLHIRGGEPARALVLVHAGNDVGDVEGCVLVGLGSSDLDGDGDTEVTQSRAALAALLTLIPEGGQTDATLTIRTATP